MAVANLSTVAIFMPLDNLLAIVTRKYFLNRPAIMLLLYFAAIPVIVADCAQIPTQKNEIINELVIRNTTNSELLDVALRVPDKNRLVSINLILPYREYSLGFRNLENQRDHAVLTWVHRRRSYTRRVDAPVSESVSRDRIYRAVITVYDDGLILTHLEPQSSALN